MNAMCTDDAGFNRNQLKGLNKAVAKVGGTAIPEVSHSTSDYAPNFNNAIRKGANIIVAAGFLLASTEATYAKKFPNIISNAKGSSARPEVEPPYPRLTKGLKLFPVPLSPLMSTLLDSRSLTSTLWCPGV